ncbi:MAG: MotA/TolQ/ExbB proton channel family protein [Fibrobacter sp.]|nr:MotA/TolQ/ExbB proton channel family protein [Fibrobacter sp.]
MLSLINYYAVNGGIINGAIFFVAVAILYIGLSKLFQYKKIRLHSKQQSAENLDYVYGSFIAGFSNNKNSCSLQFFKNRYREYLLMVIPELESGLDTMATLIQIAPFLGLLGTVAGMIETFSLITTYGTANPVILTEGITVSLLTTQAGLVVAFPCMLFHNYLCNKKEFLVREIFSQGEYIASQLKKR